MPGAGAWVSHTPATPSPDNSPTMASFRSSGTSRVSWCQDISNDFALRIANCELRILLVPIRNTQFEIRNLTEDFSDSLQNLLLYWLIFSLDRRGEFRQ